MMLFSCVGAAETMPSHSPLGKRFNLLQFSPNVGRVFPYKKRNMLFVDCPVKCIYIHLDS